MASYSSFFVEKKIPIQKTYDGVIIPAVLSPAVADSNNLQHLVAAVKEQKPWLELLLHKHGAILFQGFDSLATASDFNDFVEAFGYEELPYVGGASPRTRVVNRVFTANESPPDQEIVFHHELAHLPVHPSKLFFFCEVEPGSGGETGIAPSHVVYERMKQKYPEFVEKLMRMGLMYKRIMTAEDDPSSAIGRGWKSTFLTDDKCVAQERAAKINAKLEWADDGRVKMVMGPTPAFRYDSGRQRWTWFNTMVGAYKCWGDAHNDPTTTVSFGDGSPLPGPTVLDCLRIMEEEAVAVPWKRGDVLLMDNFAVLHSRRPFAPPRRILASLCK